LVEGNQAPGFPAGTTLSRFDRGVVLGGNGSERVYGLAAFLDTPAGLGFASLVTDSQYEALVVVQEGAAVPDVAGASIESPNTPVMGRAGAVIRYQRIGPGDATATALGLADYSAKTFRTLVAAGEAMPGGGTLADIQLAFALNDSAQLIFRGTLEDGGAAYYALSTADAEAGPRRLVATGDVVVSPGGSAEITALGMIPATGGLGGEATAIGATHFTVGATIDQVEGAVLLVENGE
jgi:hypothetical protein